MMVHLLQTNIVMNNKGILWFQGHQLLFPVCKKKLKRPILEDDIGKLLMDAKL